MFILGINTHTQTDEKWKSNAKGKVAVLGSEAVLNFPSHCRSNFAVEIRPLLTIFKVGELNFTRGERSNSNRPEQKGVRKWIAVSLGLTSPLSAVLYVGILVIFAILFYWQINITVYSESKQVSDLASDLLVVFGVLLGLTPLLKNRNWRFNTAVISVVGVIVSLMTKILAETTQDLSRMTILITGAFSVFLILVAIYPFLILSTEQPESASSPEK